MTNSFATKLEVMETKMANLVELNTKEHADIMKKLESLECGLKVQNENAEKRREEYSNKFASRENVNELAKELEKLKKFKWQVATAILILVYLIDKFGDRIKFLDI